MEGFRVRGRDGPYKKMGAGPRTKHYGDVYHKVGQIEEVSFAGPDARWGTWIGRGRGGFGHGVRFFWVVRSCLELLMMGVVG